jgi:DNA polymerase-3 subunit alpha
VRVGGILTQLRETRTRRGAVMAFGTLEDLDGSFDLVVFAEPYASFGSLLKRARADAGGAPIPLLVTGQLEEGDTPKVLVREVLELERAEERLTTQLRLRVHADEATRDRLLALREILRQHPGECEVVLQLVIPGESETLLALPDAFGVRAGAPLLQDLTGLFGRDVAVLAT